MPTLLSDRSCVAAVAAVNTRTRRRCVACTVLHCLSDNESESSSETRRMLVSSEGIETLAISQPTQTEVDEVHRVV